MDKLFTHSAKKRSPIWPIIIPEFGGSMLFLTHQERPRIARLGDEESDGPDQEIDTDSQIEDSQAPVHRLLPRTEFRRRVNHQHRSRLADPPEMSEWMANSGKVLQQLGIIWQNFLSLKRGYRNNR